MYDVNQNVISNSNVNNTITFTGRVYDSESNLYYYRNRMYSPELARFISKDPKGYVDGMNLYAYVKNNPLRYLDPMGTTVRDSRSDDYDVVEQTIKFTNAQGQPSTLTYSTNSSDYNIETKTKNTVTTIGQIGKMSYSTIVNPSMTKATYGNNSYKKFSTGIEIIEGNGKSPYNPNSPKVLQNEYVTTPYVQPTQYEKDKASAQFLSEIAFYSQNIMTFVNPLFGLGGIVLDEMAYSINPDKNDDLNQQISVDNAKNIFDINNDLRKKGK